MEKYLFALSILRNARMRVLWLLSFYLDSCGEHGFPMLLARISLLLLVLCFAVIARLAEIPNASIVCECSFGVHDELLSRSLPPPSKKKTFL